MISQAGAALPTSVVSMSSNTHNYDSDPGVTWDVSLTISYLNKGYYARSNDVYPFGSIEFSMNIDQLLDSI